MKEKSSTFALDNDEEPTAFAYTDFTDYDTEDDYDEPTALATDSGKIIPILEGEVAERFVRLMRENEERAKKRAKQQMSKKDAEKNLMYEKMLLKFDMQNIEKRKSTIKKLEEIINSAS